MQFVLLGPAVSAVLICAYVVESHFLFGTSRLRLEEDGLTMRTLGAGMIFGARQRWIGYDVGYNVRQLVDFVHNFVNVNAVGVGLLLVVTISTGIHENLVVLVLLGVQHVVAFLAKPNAHKARSLGMCGIEQGCHYLSKNKLNLI